LSIKNTFQDIVNLCDLDDVTASEIAAATFVAISPEIMALGNAAVNLKRLQNLSDNGGDPENLRIQASLIFEDLATFCYLSEGGVAAPPNVSEPTPEPASQTNKKKGSLALNAFKKT
jgi:hypothetical protein